MSQLTTPQTENISEFLSMLYGLTISATECEPLTADEKYVVATYVDDQEQPTAAIVADLAGAAKLAAALTQIPAGGVEDTIAAGELTPALQDNLSEVFNILVNLFPTDNETRLSFSEASYTENIAPPHENSVSVSLDIQRYDTGRIELLF